MSITLNLEVAKGVSIEDVKGALSGVECSDYSETKSGFSVKLTNTNAMMSVNANIEDSDILAEGLEGAEWSVGLRIYFDVDATLQAPFDDVKKIVLNLSEQVPFEFVLSFQYESIYAQRDFNGLELSEDF
ncbi:hypothetical protein [Marinobacter sp. SS5-14b]|uniref:hypothetical protein n=1 Tax=Marinobacter sp. SS5-14b TaxID=3050456 RepID=UPI0026DF104D|nr:hypothetical protein [Marinobacter sp. SS5-14b]